MSIVSRKLKTIDRGRQKLVDAGLRPLRVFIRRGEWSAGEQHLGSLSNTDVEITPRPEVLERGYNLIVSNVTPPFNGGGWTIEQIKPTPAAGVNWHFLVADPAGTLRPYRMVDFNAQSPFRYSFTLEPLDLQRPESDL